MNKNTIIDFAKRYGLTASMVLNAVLVVSVLRSSPTPATTSRAEFPPGPEAQADSSDVPFSRPLSRFNGDIRAGELEEWEAEARLRGDGAVVWELETSRKRQTNWPSDKVKMTVAEIYSNGRWIRDGREVIQTNDGVKITRFWRQGLLYREMITLPNNKILFELAYQNGDVHWQPQRLDKTALQ